ncbi:glycosyltransferase [Pacificibacter sp.]|uniref:glycosyltransferase n=1 Tax=Pacificibacter sp. TaxID=1917866 RepID=UPI00321AF000
MSVHVLIYTHHWTVGGIEKVIHNITQGLESRGYTFSILTNDVPSPERQFRLGKNARVYFRDFKPFDVTNAERMKSLILRINPDIAVVMGSNRSNLWVPRALAGTPVPVIMSEHNTQILVAKNFINPEIYRAARAIVDFNHVLLPNYMSTFSPPSKTRVIGNPFNSNINVEQKIDLSTRENTVLCLARYDYIQKQPQVLVKAFAEIVSRHPDWKLSLFGGNWKRGQNNIQALVKRLNLEGQVEVNDHTDDVIGEMQKAKILAFPSAYEGFPLVAVDALASGLPVVAFSECEGVNHLVRNGENGVLVHGDVKDYKAFANGLEQLMLDEDFRLQLAENAPASVADYSHDIFLDNWDSLFKEAYAKKGRNILANPNAIERHYLELLFDYRMEDISTKELSLAREAERAKKYANAREWVPLFVRKFLNVFSPGHGLKRIAKKLLGVR